MSTSRSRIDVLVLLFLAVAVIVIGHLFVVMVSQHDVWAARSNENRWAFRSVPSLRGAIHDRHGRVLAHDEPTMELQLYYLRFRLYHPLGAAVTGATTWARQQPGRELTTYEFVPGTFGPEAAVHDLLAMPACILQPDVLPKEKKATGPLATAVTTVLAATTGMPRREVYRALRDAGKATPMLPCGDVLADYPQAEVVRRFLAVLDYLSWFDHELALHLGEEEGGLFKALEEQRMASLTGRHTWSPKRNDDGELVRDDNGEVVMRQGEKWEAVSWTVADDVPFDLAAGLRTGSTPHPGLIVRPSLRRVRLLQPGSSLHAIVGGVKNLHQLVPEEEDGVREQFYARVLPEGDWLAELLPEDASLSATERRRIASRAEEGYFSSTMRNERGGRSGLEQDANAELSGRLGMRLVERDSKSREQWMWSNLRVNRGEDVTITIDTRLQDLAEAMVRDAQARFAAEHVLAKDQQRVSASMALIDARSGDVLAVAGAPVKGDAPRQVPGLVWFTNGSLGSVVKPFVLIEQLASEVAGRPHTPSTEIEACSGSFIRPGLKLSCKGHWDEGKDPVAAVALSCNQFFYQVADGLGMAGVDRALQRFGLRQPPEGSEFAACWQASVNGCCHAPDLASPASMWTRAIGYGIAATPLSVARAYAGLATGRLPTLGLRAGKARPVVSLESLASELEVVRRGLWDCVHRPRGTANGVAGLQEFSVFGKTGTAEINSTTGFNNAWFAGFLPEASVEGVQLAFCAVIYFVKDGTHGADAAGGMIADTLQAMRADRVLAERYLPLRADGEGR